MCETQAAIRGPSCTSTSGRKGPQEAGLEKSGQTDVQRAVQAPRERRERTQEKRQRWGKRMDGTKETEGRGRDKKATRSRKREDNRSLANASAASVPTARPFRSSCFPGKPLSSLTVPSQLSQLASIRFLFLVSKTKHKNK